MWWVPQSFFSAEEFVMLPQVDGTKSQNATRVHHKS
jgi:hypothetical protein